MLVNLWCLLSRLILHLFLLATADGIFKLNKQNNNKDIIPIHARSLNWRGQNRPLTLFFFFFTSARDQMARHFYTKKE